MKPVIHLVPKGSAEDESTVDVWMTYASPGDATCPALGRCVVTVPIEPGLLSLINHSVELPMPGQTRLSALRNLIASLFWRRPNLRALSHDDVGLLDTLHRSEGPLGRIACNVILSQSPLCGRECNGRSPGHSRQGGCSWADYIKVAPLESTKKERHPEQPWPWLTDSHPSFGACAQ